MPYDLDKGTTKFMNSENVCFAEHDSGASEFRQDLSQGGTDVREEGSFHRSDRHPLGMGFGHTLVHLSGLISI